MNKKNAFSLVEVLLVMGIIAVVMAMGFSISKNSMEKAHNQYWFTGYNALRIATIDAAEKVSENLSEDSGMTAYTGHLAQLMNATSAENCNGITIDGAASCRSVAAPNGIRYFIWHGSVGEGQTLDHYIIDMIIPALRQRGVTFDRTRFIYPFGSTDFPHTEVIIYPAVGPANQGYLNLQDRIDLLTFYLTDGDSTSDISRTFYSFREAFCQANGNDYTNETGGSIDCPSEISPNDELQGLLIVPINPKKAF